MPTPLYDNLKEKAKIALLHVLTENLPTITLQEANDIIKQFNELYFYEPQTQQPNED